MHEAITKALSSSASAEIFSDANLPYFAALALLLVFWVAGCASEIATFFTKRLFHQDDAADQMFERRNISARKCCPGCTEELPLSTLICGACDYNFLSGSTSHGRKLLPAPPSAVDRTPARQIA